MKSASRNVEFDRKSTVNTNGTKTYSWELGPEAGYPLIFVHGFRGDHHGLSLIAKKTQNLLTASGINARIIIPDLPGFGKSTGLKSTHSLDAYGSWLQDFCLQVAPEQKHSIIAHSFGTLISTNAISQGLAPEHLTLINPITIPALSGPNALGTKAAQVYYKLASILPSKAGLAVLKNAFIVRIMSEVMAKTRDKELRSWIHRQHHQYFSVFADRKTLLEAFNASITHTVLDYAKALTMPTCILAGTRDDITPLSAQLALQQQLPEANLYPIGGVGHLVHYEAPDEAAEIIFSQLLSHLPNLTVNPGETWRRKHGPQQP